MDALAHHRHTLGLPATSVAWGLWKQASALTGHLDTADVARMARTGLLALSTEEGLALLDDALAHVSRCPWPYALDPVACAPGRVGTGGTARDAAASGPLPRTAGGRPGAGRGAGRAAGDLGARPAAGVPRDEERRQVLLDLVLPQRRHRPGTHQGRRDRRRRSFSRSWLRLATSVELRNRLGAAVRKRLPATLVFDHPTPAALAATSTRCSCPTRRGVRPAARGARPHRDGTTTSRVHNGGPQKLTDRCRLPRPAGNRTPTRPTGPERTSRRRCRSHQAATDDEIFDFIDKELGIS